MSGESPLKLGFSSEKKTAFVWKAKYMAVEDETVPGTQVNRNWPRRGSSWPSSELFSHCAVFFFFCSYYTGLAWSLCPAAQDSRSFAPAVCPSWKTLL
jgi:hypothetical protein